MAIRVGSLVMRQFGANGANPCLEHLWDVTEHDARLDICVGMVIEDISDELEVIVNWLQMCPYAVKTGQISQESVERDLLTEVGQLIPESDNCVAFGHESKQTCSFCNA